MVSKFHVEYTFVTFLTGQSLIIFLLATLGKIKFRRINSSSNLQTFFHEAFPQLVYLRNLSQGSQPWIQSSHFLYRILDSKKTTRSQFSVPGLREIHRNLKQEKSFNSRESFFRKSPFCTFSYINPGSGGPWDKLWIFFIPIFIMLQKNALAKKNFEFHAQVQKCHFGKI